MKDTGASMHLDWKPTLARQPVRSLKNIGGNRPIAFSIGPGASFQKALNSEPQKILNPPRLLARPGSLNCSKLIEKIKAMEGGVAAPFKKKTDLKLKLRNPITIKGPRSLPLTPSSSTKTLIHLDFSKIKKSILSSKGSSREIEFESPPKQTEESIQLGNMTFSAQGSSRMFTTAIASRASVESRAQSTPDQRVSFKNIDFPSIVFDEEPKNERQFSARKDKEAESTEDVINISLKDVVANHPRIATHIQVKSMKGAVRAITPLPSSLFRQSMPHSATLKSGHHLQQPSLDDCELLSMKIEKYWKASIKPRLQVVQTKDHPPDSESTNGLEPNFFWNKDTSSDLDFSFFSPQPGKVF